MQTSTWCIDPRINVKPASLLHLFAAAPEEEWNKLLLSGMTVGKGEISPDELYAVTKKRIERTLIRTVIKPSTLDFVHLYFCCSVSLQLDATPQATVCYDSYTQAQPFLYTSPFSHTFSITCRKEVRTSNAFSPSILRVSSQEQKRLSKFFRESHNSPDTRLSIDSIFVNHW